MHIDLGEGVYVETTGTSKKTLRIGCLPTYDGVLIELSILQAQALFGALRQMDNAGELLED